VESDQTLTFETSDSMYSPTTSISPCCWMTHS